MLRTLLNLGVKESTPLTQRKYIQSTNMACLVVSILVLNFLPVAISSQNTLVVTFHLLVPVLFVFALILSAKEHLTFARHLVSILCLTVIFFMFLMFGAQLQGYIYFFAVIAAIPLIHPAKAWRAFYIYEFIAIVLFSISYWFHDKIEPLYTIQNEFERMAVQYVPIASFIFCFVILYFFRQFMNRGDYLFERENERAENLLLNILPVQIAHRLQEGEKVIADKYDSVSVLHADIVGFTQLASSVSANELVEILSEIFSHFDELAKKHNVEKIKTIGDAYLAASGIPKENASHAQDMVAFARDIVEWMQTSNYESKGVLIRIGINSGPIIAGVIGLKKFVYDIWGNTVNIAQHIESAGKSHQIHISESTYLLVKDQIETEPRGEITLDDGSKMRTWWVKH